MAETSPELRELIALTGQVYLAHEVPEVPADGDQRLIEDPEGDPNYIKLEVYSAGQWHLVESWLYLKEFRWFKPSWTDPWALIKIFQRLLQTLKGHLELKLDNIDHHYYYARIREASADKEPCDKALAEADDLLARNRSET